MKVLYMNTFFKLPDDFEGTLNDALMEIIKYRESQGYKKPRINSDKPKEKITNPSIEKLWKQFQQSMEEGFRLHGAISCSEYDPDNKKWNSIIN